MHGLCSECERWGFVCEMCGKCTLCGSRRSLLSEHLCAECAGDPVTPPVSEMLQWIRDGVEEADWCNAFSVRRLRGESLYDAVANNDYLLQRIWDDLYDAQYDYLKTGEGLRYIVYEALDLSDEEAAVVLASSDPFEVLADEYDFEVDQYAAEDANFSVELTNEEINRGDNKDDHLLVAEYFGAPVIEEHSNSSTIWRAMELAATEKKEYGLANQYRRMGISILMMPDEFVCLETRVEFDSREILGICPQCMRPLPRHIVLEDAPDCYCGEPIKLRQAQLLWLHHQGKLPQSPDVFLKSENSWIVWPGEVESRYTVGEVYGEIYDYVFKKEKAAGPVVSSIKFSEL